jgi:hypothetical protein
MPGFLNIDTKILIIAIAVLWSLPWKGFALWKSARKGDSVWFIILLLMNTLAILEILYIFIFSEKKNNSNFPRR